MFVRFYLPYEATGYSDLLAECTENITREFGGCTMVQGVGNWRNPESGRIERERVTIIEVQGGNGNSRTMRDWFTRLADKIRKKGEQHTVFFQTITGAEGHSVGPTTIVPPPHRQDK